MIALLGALAL
ncbi:hypothetical protein VCHC72A2_00235A, partial [Vibrio cholerae HC-72A2]